MGKKTALPKDAPNRRTSRVGSVKSRNNKTSRNDGSVDLVGSLAPNQGKRTGKDFADSPPATKGKRVDGLGDEDSTRKGDGYTGARAHVHRTPGIEATRMPKNLIETTQDTDAPDVLDIP
jgi:hypothetical protein